VTSESERDAPADEPTHASDRTGVFVVDTGAERDDAFSVRRSVFVAEQGVDEGIEYDDFDDPAADATHFVAYADGDAVGAARLRTASDAAPASGADDPVVGKVERVAVAADRRGEGWGRRLMSAVETRAAEAGFGRLALHAQTHVREFYERLGYDAHGDVFEEAGIPHVAMAKAIDGDG
jgi:predicted GNAT family N-acyltransferase